MGYRRAIRLRPVHSIKHVVDSSATVPINTNTPVTLVKAVDNPIFGNTEEVATASIVKAIYLRVEVASNQVMSAGAIPNVYIAILKDPGADLTLPSPNAIGVYDLRKFIIHQEMVMIENIGQGGNPRVLFQGVIKIPRRYQRFGQNDVLRMLYLSPAMATALCLQCIYKEFR